VEPENFRFGGGSAGTMLNPVVAVVMILAIVAMFVLRRKYVIVPLLLTVFLTPFGQVVVVGGFHFIVYRILVLFAMIRILILRSTKKGGTVAVGFNRIDWAFALSYGFGALNFVLLYMEMPALVNQLGVLVDTIIGYFVLRFLIQDAEDVRRVLKLFAAVATIMALAMLGEQATRQNIFHSIGAFPIEVREGTTRSHGAFASSILAGSFGAAIFPLFVALWKWGRCKVAAFFGMISATIIVLTSHSSTPLGAYIWGLLALCMWPLRKKMRPIRWGIAITLLLLHLAMKAPVWALIARVDFTGSSSGYHRFMLVDNCIRHFADWWLLGTKDYGNWGWDMFDLCDEYVARALTGGFLAFFFFIAIICWSFGKIGTARKLAAGNPKQEWLLWSLGASMLVHVMAYFGISFFDQTQVEWFILLAIISVAVSQAKPSFVQRVEKVDASWNVTSPNLELPELVTNRVSSRIF
jgi:hypothetical protein